MKCLKCGTELLDGAKFCSNCGSKVNGKFGDEQVAKDMMNVEEKKDTVANKGNGKLRSAWKRMDWFCKIVAVAITVILVLLLVSVLAEKGVATFLSVFQLVALVISLLMHKNVIKVNEKWIKYLVLIVAVLLIAVNIKSYSWGDEKNKDDKNDKHVFSDSTASQLVKESEATVAIIPYEAAECIGQKYSEIKKVFSEAGFSNIKIKKIENITMAETDRLNTVSSVSIAETTNFSKGQELDSDVEILIEYCAYKKCAVAVHVDFVPNLIFNTYDVNLLLNNSEKGILVHGEDQDFSFEIDPGEYSVTFVSSESSSIKGEVLLDVDCDMEVSYKILCYGDEVSVETLYVDRQEQLAENEVKLDVATSNYKNKNYVEVTTALETLGFTNIKYNILYDIYFGFTANGTVDSVSIAGNSNCNRGEIFAKDTEIIITYHMPEEDDPINIKVPKSSSMYDGMNYLEVEQIFRDLGFTNFELDKVTTEDTFYNDGEELFVEIGGWSFDAGDTFKPNSKVYIKYYSVVEPIVVEKMTVENNDDFAEIMRITNQMDDETIKKFVDEHTGDAIGFNGCIALMMNHKEFSTRFDVCLAGGDYYADRVYGPLFSFENVNYFDMNVSGTDTVAEGMDFYVEAKIIGFDDEGCTIVLEPISLTKR